MNIVNKYKRIAVGISGGVDSAVAAYLLKKQGYETVGIFMKNWDLIDETGICSVEKDFTDAQEVCRLLQIPLLEANFVKEYWTEVFEQVINDYKNGLTPNPDILCNKKIKFKYFLDFALNKINANTIATGHYARNVFSETFRPPGNKLFKAEDPIKDQTFFLSQIPQFALSRTIFPLGDLLKSQVKQIAINNKLLKYARKKESMGICFIGRRNFKDFMSEYVIPSKGNLIDLDTGEIVMQHQGKHNWTIGQRCNIGGCLQPYYIAFKTKTEDIYVARGHGHPALYSDTITTEKAFWIHSEHPDLSNGGILKCQFRFQHGKPLTNCVIYKMNHEKLFIELEKPLRALTPGQYAVFYSNSECLGSARIICPGPSEYGLNMSRAITVNPS